MIFRGDFPRTLAAYVPGPLWALSDACRLPRPPLSKHFQAFSAPRIFRADSPRNLVAYAPRAHGGLERCGAAPKMKGLQPFSGPSDFRSEPRVGADRRRRASVSGSSGHLTCCSRRFTCCSRGVYMLFSRGLHVVLAGPFPAWNSGFTCCSRGPCVLFSPPRLSFSPLYMLFSRPGGASLGFPY